MSTRSVIYLNTSSWYSLQTRSFIKWQTFWSDHRKAINIEESPEWSIQLSTCGLTNLPACWNDVIRQDLWIFDLLSQIDVSQSNQKNYNTALSTFLFWKIQFDIKWALEHHLEEVWVNGGEELKYHSLRWCHVTCNDRIHLLRARKWRAAI